MITEHPISSEERMMNSISLSRRLYFMSLSTEMLKEILSKRMALSRRSTSSRGSLEKHTTSKTLMCFNYTIDEELVASVYEHCSC